MKGYDAFFWSRWFLQSHIPILQKVDSVIITWYKTVRQILKNKTDELMKSFHSIIPLGLFKIMIDFEECGPHAINQ